MNAQYRDLLLNMGPLIVFFIAFKYLGIFGATAAIMTASVIALLLGYILEKRLLAMPVITALLVLIFGGLTLYLKNDTFIKMKPSVLYAFFGATLIGGLAFRRLFLKYVFAQTFNLDEPAWRQLTWRWGVFFLALAVLNEIVWRHASTSAWVSFKVWGIIPLIFLFALAQTPFVMKHHVEPEQPTD
jgi:intracellular septation protein